MIDIDTILDTIPETTFNIKIIQLNAAIEAARAGEQGSGFATGGRGVPGLGGTHPRGDHGDDRQVRVTDP